MASVLRLEDLASLRRAGNGGKFEDFVAEPLVARLGWPDGPIREFLFHPEAADGWALDDYPDLDLRSVTWECESLPVAEYLVMPTAPSDQEWFIEMRSKHERWANKRPDWKDSWDGKGTWLVPPVVIEKRLLGQGGGLHLIEGRHRVSILCGRHLDGFPVAPSHLAWVGRMLGD